MTGTLLGTGRQSSRTIAGFGVWQRAALSVYHVQMYNAGLCCSSASCCCINCASRQLFVFALSATYANTCVRLCMVLNARRCTLCMMDTMMGTLIATAASDVLVKVTHSRHASHAMLRGLHPQPFWWQPALLDAGRCKLGSCN